VNWVLQDAAIRMFEIVREAEKRVGPTSHRGRGFWDSSNVDTMAPAPALIDLGSGRRCAHSPSLARAARGVSSASPPGLTDPWRVSPDARRQANWFP
jgi:hypothetical protein